MRDLVLTIDLGTSGPKVGLFDSSLTCVADGFEPVDLLLGDDGRAEQRPEQWRSAVSAASRRMLATAPDLAGRVRAVVCTSQWSGTVALDADGTPLRDALIWMDTRGAGPLARVTGGPVRVAGYHPVRLAKWIRYTGGIPGHAGKDSLAHILYLQEAEPETYRRAWRFLEPKDYLNFWLTGRAVASGDSITLHWVTDTRDLSAIDYHPSLLAMTGLDREKLPEIVPINGVIGELTTAAAADLGVAAGLEVLAGTPDLHSAAVGSGATAYGQPHLYVGTSAWLLTHLPKPKTSIIYNMATIPSAVPGRYLLANEQETAGACLTWQVHQLLFRDDELASQAVPPDVYRRFDTLAAEVSPGADGLIFLPWLVGERTPVEDHHARGGLYNLALHHHRGHVARAVLEGVALNAAWLLEGVRAVSRDLAEPLHFIGGGAKSALWCQIMADVLNTPIRQMRDPLLANSRGVAILAWSALEGLDVDRIAERAPVTALFEPRAEYRDLYAERLAVFKQIYARNKGIFKRLQGAG